MSLDVWSGFAGLVSEASHAHLNPCSEAHEAFHGELECAAILSGWLFRQPWAQKSLSMCPIVFASSRSIDEAFVCSGLLEISRFAQNHIFPVFACWGLCWPLCSSEFPPKAASSVAQKGTETKSIAQKKVWAVRRTNATICYHPCHLEMLSQPCRPLLPIYRAEISRQGGE